MRIVPNQSETAIFQLFKKHVEKICPPWVRIEIRNLHGGEPYLAPIDSPEMQAAQRALKHGFGTQPAFIREGGSIPVVNKFKALLHKNPVLIGYGLPDENTHAPNEHFDLDNYHKGIMSNIHLYRELGMA
jgi:succinyl-diaminopimelate desuccinylase